MKKLALGVACLCFTACTTTTDRMPLPEPDGLPKPAPRNSPKPRAPVSEDSARSQVDLNKLQAQLGLNRESSNLGYAEKAFDGCRAGLKGEDGKCGSRFFTVVNFRLVCRDSEDTVETVVTSTRPLYSDQVKWKLADLNGVTSTDSNGYGTLQVVGVRPSKGKRLVLTVGRQFLGLEISQVRQIVLPTYWCSQIAQWNFDVHNHDGHLSCQNSSHREANLSVQ